MRILHFADVHLDRPFVGLSSEAGDRRRRELFESLRRCLDLAVQEQVDLVTIGGDLWEEEHVLADTRNSVAHELGKIELPILLICGNHDPLVPGGSYLRTTWPSNVQLVPRGRLTEFPFGGTSIWAISWGGKELPHNLLGSVELPEDGRKHLLLIHGSSTRVCFGDLAAYFPFDPAAVAAAGFDRCLAGHVHIASDVDGVVYPGSPEPLGWGEEGRHCVAIVDVGENVSVKLIDVNEARYEDRDVDCTGCESSAELESRLTSALTDDDAASIFLRVRLVGEVGPDCIVNPSAAGGRHAQRYAALRLVDKTEPILDVEARARSRGLDGILVQRLQERIAEAPSERERRVAELALQAGLRALDGRDVILRVD